MCSMTASQGHTILIEAYVGSESLLSFRSFVRPLVISNVVEHDRQLRCCYCR